MKAGLLNKVILFERRKDHKNKFGEEEIRWKPFTQARACVEDTTGTRSAENVENFVSYTKTFTVRTYPGYMINEDMSILFDGRRYRINSILREKGRTTIQGTYWNE